MSLEDDVVYAAMAGRACARQGTDPHVVMADEKITVGTREWSAFWEAHRIEKSRIASNGVLLDHRKVWAERYSKSAIKG